MFFWRGGGGGHSYGYICIYIYIFVSPHRMPAGCCTWARMTGPMSTAAYGLQRCMKTIVLFCKCTVPSQEGATW